MKLKELLLEIADKPLPFKSFDEKDGILGTFKSKGGLYIVWALEHDGVHELTFSTEGAHGFSPASRGESEKDNVFEVLATVKAIYKKWFEKYKPEKVKYAVLDKHMQRHKIFNRMLKEFGYGPSGASYYERKEK